MDSFEHIYERYQNVNRKHLNSTNIIHEMNGAVLNDTNVTLFDLHSQLYEEVVRYCKEQDFIVDKVLFLDLFERNVERGEGVNTNLRMKSDSKISIIQEDGEVVARVIVGEYINIKKYERS